MQTGRLPGPGPWLPSAPTGRWPRWPDLFRLPLHELLFRAHSVHRAHFDPAEVQISTLMSIKTGGCPEDCGYCPQSVHFNTGLTPEALVPLAAVVDAARAARDRGATRFCMGAAYRNPKPGQLAKITEMVRAVHDLGLETCATLGMLTRDQADVPARRRASTTTTTTWTRRRPSIPRSSPPGPMRTGSTP